MKGFVQMNFHIEPELKKELKRYCIERDLTMHNVLNEAIRQIVKHGKTDIMTCEQEQLEMQRREEKVVKRIESSWESSY